MRGLLKSNLPVAALMCGILAGCGGGGSSGGEGELFDDTDRFAAFDAALTSAQNTSPTRTPLTGRASYTGQVKIGTGLASGTAVDEAIIGDLGVDINFDTSLRPVTASATNFSGVVNGTQVDVAGTLSTQNAPNGRNSTQSIATVTPAGGTLTNTRFDADLSGQLSDPTGTLTGAATVNLQGQLQGANGAVSSGQATAIFTPVARPILNTSGTFYLDSE